MPDRRCAEIVSHANATTVAGGCDTRHRHAHENDFPDSAFDCGLVVRKFVPQASQQGEKNYDKIQSVAALLVLLVCSFAACDLRM